MIAARCASGTAIENGPSALNPGPGGLIACTRNNRWGRYDRRLVNGSRSGLGHHHAADGNSGRWRGGGTGRALRRGGGYFDNFANAWQWSFLYGRAGNCGGGGDGFSRYSRGCGCRCGGRWRYGRSDNRRGNGDYRSNRRRCRNGSRCGSNRSRSNGRNCLRRRCGSDSCRVFLGCLEFARGRRRNRGNGRPDNDSGRRWHCDSRTRGYYDARRWPGDHSTLRWTGGNGRLSRGWCHDGWSRARLGENSARFRTHLSRGWDRDKDRRRDRTSRCRDNRGLRPGGRMRCPRLGFRRCFFRLNGLEHVARLGDIRKIYLRLNALRGA